MQNTEYLRKCLYCCVVSFFQSSDIQNKAWRLYLTLFVCFKTEHRERSKFKSERNDVEGSYNPVSASPSKSTEQYSSAQSIPSAVTVIAPAHHLENTTESWSNYYNNHSNPSSFGRNPPPKRRCRDYDGKLPISYFSFSYLFQLFCDLF